MLTEGLDDGKGCAVSTGEQGSQDRVFGDVGGWISGPSLDVERLGGPRFGINVSAWMKEYGTRYVLQGGFDGFGFGFVCWRRSGDGRPAGQPMAARTLDELAEWADRYEAQTSKPAGS
jgi:hypothetical protein